ncbi:MAG: hydrogenase maturation protease [Myxococcota bacterium]
MKRIVCIGNRYLSADDVGARVHDALVAGELPEDTDVVDGGLGGLNLLPCFDDARCVVFVDAVSGFGEPGSMHEMDGARVAAWAGGALDHAAGLPYLLRMAPMACDGPMPPVMVLGVEVPAGKDAVAAAARRALHLANALVDYEFCERGVA